MGQTGRRKFLGTTLAAIAVPFLPVKSEAVTGQLMRTDRGGRRIEIDQIRFRVYDESGRCVKDTAWLPLTADYRMQPIARWMTVTLDGKPLDYCVSASEPYGYVETYKQPFEIDWNTGKERLIRKHGRVVLGLSPDAPDDVVRDYYQWRGGKAPRYLAN